MFVWSEQMPGRQQAQDHRRWRFRWLGESYKPVSERWRVTFMEIDTETTVSYMRGCFCYTLDC